MPGSVALDALSGRPRPAHIQIHVRDSHVLIFRTVDPMDGASR
jgi:hypothetical protein